MVCVRNEPESSPAYHAGVPRTHLVALTLVFVACEPDPNSGFAPAPVDADNAGDSGIGEPYDPDSWVLEATVDLGAGVSVQWIAELDGWWYGFADSGGVLHRWRTDGSEQEQLILDGAAGGTSEEGVGCQVEDRFYLLAGGGNGVFSPNIDYHWEGVDLAGRAWLEGGHHDFPYHAPGLADEGGRCLVVGGDTGTGSTMVGVVQEFLPESGGWDYHPPAPLERRFPAACTVGSTLLVAGGGQSATGGEDGWTWYGTAAADAAWRDLEGGTDWTDAPPLPEARLLLDCAGFRGRHVVFGGVVNSDGGFGLGGDVWSWAPGEEVWMLEGGMPVLTHTYRVLIRGDELYMAILEVGAVHLYRWAR